MWFFSLILNATALSSSSFNDIANSVKNASFNDEKLLILRSVDDHHHFTYEGSKPLVDEIINRVLK